MGIDEIRRDEREGKDGLLGDLRGSPLVFNHFRVRDPHITLIEGDAFLVSQKVVLVLVDLLDLFSTQSLEDLVPLLLLKRELHWLLAGAGKALDLLTLVEPAFLPWAYVDRKHGSDFGLEVADGVSS